MRKLVEIVEIAPFGNVPTRDDINFVASHYGEECVPGHCILCHPRLTDANNIGIFRPHNPKDLGDVQSGCYLVAVYFLCDAHNQVSNYEEVENRLFSEIKSQAISY